MNNFHNAFFHHMHHINRHSGHMFGQEKILTTLLEKGAMTQSDLLGIIDIKAPSLSETLSKLEKKKLVKRDDSAKDKRSNVISLTEDGEKLAKGYRKFRDRFEKRMFGALNEEEKEQMMTLLEKMHANIDKDEHSHFHFRGGHFGFDHYNEDEPEEK
jgi:DNA-binding MarR family transcriptional regulator